MNLLECEGKKILKECGIAIPQGQLVTGRELPQGLSYPLALKSQVPVGGRGKAGGIRIVKDAGEAAKALEEIRNLRIKGHLPSAILAEETVEIRQELYISFTIDRKEKKELLLFSQSGGMDIEEINREHIVALTINPLLGLQEYQINRLFFGSSIADEPKKQIKAMVRKLYRLFKEKKLELLEINPLVITAADTVICLDAKVILEDILYYLDSSRLPRAQYSFEETTHALGVNGVELSGDIALITSGAGLGLATIDEIMCLGGSVRAFVDMGPLVHHKEEMMKVIRLAADLKPKAFLFVYFFQVASCVAMAEAIVNTVGDIPTAVRSRGREEAEAKMLLEQKGCYVTTNFHDAVSNAIALASKGGM